MRKVTTRMFLVLFLLGSLWPTSAPALPDGTRVQRYKGSLAFPIDIAWVPGTNRLFFTEKNTGRIRVMRRRDLLAVPCRDLDVYSGGEAGALGITLHPNFDNNHWLYVYFTNASPRDNRVVRFKVENNRCTNPKVILKGIPASSGYHNGGQLEFMNGKLFVAVGENHNASHAQNTSNRLGKILRVNPNGSIPANNPFGNRVWSYGHRNPFGLAAHPSKSWLFESENGPNCDDELNRIRRGRNFGWGASYTCGAGVGPNPVGPLRRWTPPIVPTDLWWYRGRMRKLTGSLYMGDYGNGRLHRFRLNNRGTNVVGHSIVVDMGSGITDVTKGPGGWLYFATSNAIYRIVPT